MSGNRYKNRSSNPAPNLSTPPREITDTDDEHEGNAQKRWKREVPIEERIKDESEWKTIYYEDPFDLHSKWNKLFVLSCVIALLLDPLFFYIPIIDEEKKCLGVDKKLRLCALLLRLSTDISFIVHRIYRIRKAMKIVADSHSREPTGRHSSWVSKIFNFIEYVGEIGDQLSWSSVVLDFLAILPIPQVLLVVVSFRMRGSNYWHYRKILSFFLLAQYVVRICEIYKSSMKVAKRVGTWAICLFNLSLYLIAGHILGSFWYYLSIQRETSCWHQGCGSNCTSTFYCDEYKNTTVMANLIKSLNASCPIDVPYNVTAPFDFGIFLDSLKSGNTVSKNFLEKSSFCLWWGLRNLSNFGTNLTTSNYEWENYFAIFISLMGLILFLYLIGNVQAYFQAAVTKSITLRGRIKEKEKDFISWTSKHDNLSTNLKREVVQSAIQHLKQSKEVDLENLVNLFSFIPSHTAKYLKRHLCLPIVKKVPQLQRKHEKVWRQICDNLKPVNYAEDKEVFKVNEPIDKIVFITEGTMLRVGTSATPLEKGGFYGNELIDRFASVPNPNPILSKETVKCTSRVQGFTLSEQDYLKAITTRYGGSIVHRTMSRLRPRRTPSRQKHTSTTQPMATVPEEPAEP